MGLLIYLTFTWSNLTYYVHILSQFMYQPRQELWDTAFAFSDILRVLQDKVFSSEQTPVGPTISSLIGALLVFLFLWVKLLSLGNRRNNTLYSVPPLEAEYRSIAVTYCELTRLGYLLCDLRVSQPNPTPLYHDNQVALHISSNHVF